MSTAISPDPVIATAPSQTAQISPSLPPLARDWQAYRLVKVQQLSTRAAATQLGISQTRVCQLIDRVEQYLFEIAPGEETPAARARRLYIAESVAAERIDFLFGQAVEKFHQSIGPQQTIREAPTSNGSSRPVSTTRHSPGDGRLLNAAARLAFLRGKVPNSLLLPTLPTDIECDVFEAENHPIEDCSKQSTAQAVMSQAQADNGTAKSELEKRCVPLKSVAAAPKSSNARPVQQAGSAKPQDGLTLAEMNEIAREMFLKLTQS